MRILLLMFFLTIVQAQKNCKNNGETKIRLSGGGGGGGGSGGGSGGGGSGGT